MTSTNLPPSALEWLSAGTFRISAHEFNANEYAIDAAMYLADEDERDEVAAKFPKYVAVKRSTLSGTDRVDGAFVSWRIPTAIASFRFLRDGTTGNFNEAAAKRWDAFKRVARENGFELELRTPYGNSIDDPSDARLALV